MDKEREENREGEMNRQRNGGHGGRSMQRPTVMYRQVTRDER